MFGTEESRRPASSPDRLACVRAATVATVLAALLLIACHGKERAGDSPIEVIVPNDVATLDPRFSTRSLDIKVTRLIHAGLIGLDRATLEPIPLVAKAWEWKSSRSLEIELRPSVRFHSGRPLSARDICATLDALADPALGSPHRAVVRAIGQCRILREDKLVIELSEPRATLLTDLEVPILRSDEAKSPPQSSGALDGLGPFRIGAIDSGSIRLEPASTGLGALPAHPVVVRTVRDENARALRLLAGRSDIAPNAISPTLLPALEGRADLKIVARPGANTTYLLLHNERPPFDKASARKAAAEAIDRELIVRTLLAGRARVATSLLPPGHWASPQAEPIPFRPEEARTILATLPPVTLLTGTDRSRVTIARALSQMLGDAGLRVRVVPLDFGVMLARLDAGDYEIAVLQIPELTEPNVLKWFFHPNAVPGEGGEGRNRARYRDVRSGELLDEASQSIDRQVRAARYAELASRMAETVPVIPLWHEDQVCVLSHRADAFRLSADGRWSALVGLK